MTETLTPLKISEVLQGKLQDDLPVPKTKEERAARIAAIKYQERLTESLLTMEQLGVLDPMKDYARELFATDKSVGVEVGFKIPKGNTDPEYYAILRANAKKVWPKGEPGDEDKMGIFVSKSVCIRADKEGELQIGFMREITNFHPDRKTFTEWGWDFDFTFDDERLSMRERMETALRRSPRSPDTRVGSSIDNLIGISDPYLALRPLPLNTDANFIVEHDMIGDR